MSFKSYRVGSKTDWGTWQDSALTLEQIQTGAILRIADAVEVMSKNHQKLIDERDMYQRWHDEASAARNRFERSNAALRGVITRMKREQDTV